MPQAKNAPAASFDSLQSELDQKFAYPASSKTYIAGSRPDIRVPMRTIKQTATRTDKGEMLNPPVPVYDTSGPYSDPDVHIDLKAGLAPLRAKWIDERGDTEILSGLSSEYGRTRANDPATAHLRFAQLTNPRRAKPGANVSQMHYARRKNNPRSTSPRSACASFRSMQNCPTLPMPSRSPHVCKQSNPCRQSRTLALACKALSRDR